MPKVHLQRDCPTIQTKPSTQWQNKRQARSAPAQPTPNVHALPAQHLHSTAGGNTDFHADFHADFQAV